MVELDNIKLGIINLHNRGVVTWCFRLGCIKYVMADHEFAVSRLYTLGFIHPRFILSIFTSFKLGLPVFITPKFTLRSLHC